MIKKTILMLLVLVGGVMSANAEDDIYLRTGFKGVNVWGSDEADYKFTYVETNANNEDVYTYTINASDIQESDVWFRIHISGWGAQICPYTSNGSYTFQFSNGQNETYGAKYEKQYFQGDQLSFGIAHHLINASQYKITLFRGKNEVDYENEHCRVMWIKVEIVSMPVKIGSSGYATFSCDRALNFAGTDIKAYVASSVNSTVVNMTSVTNAPAGTGLFLKGVTAGATANIPVVEESQATAVSGNLLYPGTGESVASDAADAVDCKYRYVFQNQTSGAGAGFYKLPTTGVTIPKGKAYLEISKDDAPKAPSFCVDLDGETTGIKVINFNEDNNQNNGQMFDLQGRRIAEPTKGVYIVNGKKVIIK